MNKTIIPPKMNEINAKLGRSKFVPDRHLLLTIDDVPLDEILAHRFPELNLEGLIPTTLNWLDAVEEQNEVWRRFARREPGNVLIPLLCCPDDLDFSDTLIVVNAKFDHEHVHWLQFGFDATSFDRLPNGVASSVSWFDGVGPFVFSREQYEEMACRFEELRS